MTLASIGYVLSFGIPSSPTHAEWLRVLWQTVWFVPFVWCLCALLQHRSPTVRTWLWWAGCAQMLTVCLTALPAFLSAVSEGQSGLPRLLAVAWGIGVAVRSALMVVQFQRARRLVRECVPAPACTATETAARLALRLALRGRLTVLVSPHLKIPALAGLWGSALLLPASALEQPPTPELHMALAHELAHLRRRDLWLGLLPVFAQSLLFFHPLIWLAVREYGLAREEACDAEAQRVTETAPAEYGAMLLGYVTAVCRPSDRRDPLRLRFYSLQRRLTALHTPSSKRRSRSLAAFCAVCTFGAACVSVGSLARLPLRGIPADGLGLDTFHPYDAQLAEEFSNDTTYSQPIILPPKAHRTATQALAVSGGTRVAETVTDEKTVTHRHADAVRPLRVANRLPKHSLSVPSVSMQADALRVPPFVPSERQTRVASALPADKTPHPMAVADSGETPTQSALGTPDLGTMDSTLKALRKQMKQKIAPKPVLHKQFPATPSDQQAQEQSGPQFQQRWKHHVLEFRVEGGPSIIYFRDTSVVTPTLPQSILVRPQAPPPPAQELPPFRAKIVLKFRPVLPDFSPLAIAAW